ncbi:hypothetical protein BTVI_45229 [Pitangus sulphuratus]|nr:hypothetical protein BTVI_45229 [Pitangus sulphuratus]
MVIKVYIASSSGSTAPQIAGLQRIKYRLVACGDGAQMAKEAVPQVSLLSLPSRVIFVNLDVSTVLVLLVKSR